MKYTRIYIIAIIIILLIPSIALSREVHFWDLQNTTDTEITIFNETKAIYQDKTEVINNLNESVEVYSWIPLLWPYDVNNSSEISYYPYRQWKKITNDTVIYVSASIVIENYSKMGITFPPNYLEHIKSYPSIPGILLNDTLDIGEKSGIATKTNNPTGLILTKNGTNSLYIDAITEGEVNSITIRIPRQVTQYWFFQADLKVKNISPIFADESYDPEYKIYTWNKDFSTIYFKEFGRNITANEMIINYSYIISLDDVITNIGFNLFWIIVGIILGILIQKYVEKIYPEKKDRN